MKSITQQQDLDSQSESFINTELEFQSTAYVTDGIAKLIDVELVDSENVPEEYKNNYNNDLQYKKYFVFDAKVSDEKEIQIVLVPNKTSGYYQFVMNWTDSNTISDLSNKTIPIQNIENDVYLPKNLPSKFDIENIENVKTLLDWNYIKYDVGDKDWYKTEKYERYENRVTVSSFIIALAFSFISLVITTIYLNSVTATIITFIVGFFVYTIGYLVLNKMMYNESLKNLIN